MNPTTKIRIAGAMGLATILGVGGACSGDDDGLGLGPDVETGAIEVSTATLGEEIDPDGYSVSVDGGEGQAIDVNDTLPISGLEPGDYQLELTGVAANCTVLGGNPRQVTVTVGDTARTTFPIDCAATIGSLQVRTVT